MRAAAPGSLRLFAAVGPTGELADAVADALPADGRIRWTPQQQWHVTTAFYGGVAESAVGELVDRLSRAAGRTPPFSLLLKEFSGFPSSGRSRVATVSIGGDVEELTRLAERCAAAGRRTGLPMEDRNFRPHLTVGRARGEPVDVRRWPELDVPLDWRVVSLQLVRSYLGPAVRHETYAEWPLGG